MTLLELRNVQKKYGDYAAIDDFSLSVQEGELRCLLGPNGAGKTTCMDLIVGRQRVSGGQILLRGEDTTAQAEHQIVRRGVGRKFQVPAVFKELSVRDNLEVAFGRNKDPFRNMAVFKRSAGIARFDEVMEMIGLHDRRYAIAGLLSHGETQWLEIGMVLMQNPSLLLMDEPTAGMTERETYKTSQILNALKGAHTLIVVEHDMSFVREIADVVTVMHQGKLLAQGNIQEIETHAKVKEVYLGEEGIH
ncbi:urea ABC transporter ATP-binding protein UrtD [Aminobacter anthyllidis]|uniref:urea ABC transporter ATP-binding protein UrtD n=1 Tax=Aminobacter anthyllidis TaxID=1035067 RepID=UPI0024556812|nr:urea ABC transporter ATP-binding protein UrtD [Aminobacter anthyllidis]MDH4984364.1 urea ABC transporter ATP-binding protein UrtD [Aminobacter anthyllidis]